MSEHCGRPSTVPTRTAVRSIIPAVIPLPVVLVAVGAGALVLAAIVLRSFGPGYRLGRLLARTPQVTVEEALSRARQGDGRYVRGTRRIDSAAEFEGEHHPPPGFRRRRGPAKG